MLTIFGLRDLNVAHYEGAVFLLLHTELRDRSVDQDVKVRRNVHVVVQMEEARPRSASFPVLLMIKYLVFARIRFGRTETYTLIDLSPAEPKHVPSIHILVEVPPRDLVCGSSSGEVHPRIVDIVRDGDFNGPGCAVELRFVLRVVSAHLARRFSGSWNIGRVTE